MNENSSDGSNMKRSASSEILHDDESSNKRRRRATDVRFLLQSKNAGAIIGKAGSNINRLRKDYKASVTVPDCPGPERILTIVADIETAGDILMDIIPKLEDYSHHRTMSFDCEMRMLLHQSHAGCVIGRGGQRIKELREKTGAQIKVYTACCPDSTERVAQISGFPDVVISCVKEICDLIAQAPIKGPSQIYDPHNFSVFYAPEYGGYGESGGRGGGGQGGGGQGGGRGGGQGGGRGGGGDRMRMPRGAGRRGSFGRGVQHMGAAGMMQGMMGMTDFSEANWNMKNETGEVATSELTIPNDMAGAIIGKGGERIRKIRRDSGAEITINEPKPGSAERSITINGNPRQIHLAELLLQQSMDEHGSVRY